MRTLVFLLLPFVYFCQTSDVGNWYIYFGNNRLSERFTLHNEVQWRNYDHGRDLEQLLLRAGLGYDLTPKNNTVLLGYGFIHSQQYVDKTTKKFTDEHRVFQQFNSKKKVGRFYLQQRLRIEERFVAATFGLRFRCFLGINIPINRSEMVPNAFYVSAYNEVFLNQKEPIFDRNRVYGALGYVVTNNLKFELGFMSQIQKDKQRPQFQLVLYNTLPFSFGS